MKTSQTGIDLIHSFETLRLKAYPDPGSKDGEPWTCGWGSTGADIGQGTVWTKEYADKRFADGLSKAEQAVSLLVKVPLNQNQFDALVSFTYNLGIGNLKSSTLLKMLNEGYYTNAGLQLLRWDKNDGKVMAGLTRRRKTELKLFSGEH
jgi:Phage-related lysozyme (muraminidase)